MRVLVLGFALATSLLVGGQICLAQEVTLDLPSVARLVEERSLDLKIGTAEIALREAQKVEARAPYFPSVSLRFDTEFTEDLDEDSGVVAVGDTVSTDGSAFENSLTTNVSFLLYDFGAREHRYDGARDRVRAARFNRAATFRALRLEVIDRYVQVLGLSYRWDVAMKKVRLRKTIYRQLKALGEAGTMGQTEIGGAAIDLATDVTTLDEVQLEYQKALDSLGELAQASYSVNTTTIRPLGDVFPSSVETLVEEHPAIQSYNAEIEALHRELSALKRDHLPTLNLYSSYRLYGVDNSSYADSMGDMSQLDASVALILRWDLFTGFRKTARRQQAEARLMRASLERQRAMFGLERELKALEDNLEQAGQAKRHGKERDSHIRQADVAQQRLAQNGVLDQVNFSRQQVVLLDQKLDVKLETMNRQAAALKLAVWQGGEIE